jgi:hypothetical protein
MEHYAVVPPAPTDDLIVTVDQQPWRIYLVKISRLAPDWFVQFAAIGPRTYTIFVRMAAPPADRHECRRLVGRLLESLRHDPHRACAFIDLVNFADESMSHR